MPKKTTSHASLQTRLRLILGDEIAFGPGKAELLDAIRATGSISAAAKKTGMSYRRAWLLVDTMNRCFQQPLVDATKGGSHGGGTQLTVLGEQVLRLFRDMQHEVQASTDKHFKILQALLRSQPLPSS